MRRHDADLIALQIEEPDRAVLSEDDRVGARRGRFDVVLLEPGQLRDLLRLRVKTEKVRRARAVRDEIDLIADPHRVAVVRTVARQRFDLAAGERRDPEWR